MSKIMLVNVTHVEESRVAILEDGVLAAYEIETINRANIKGNIYNAVVENVHPSLEAAFVRLTPDLKGFLPLDEVNFKLLPVRGERGKNGRIGQHLHAGQRILAQVIREPFSGKPPTVSTYFSLPGRYLVLMPGVDSDGISRKIDDPEQRERLKEIIAELNAPEGFGVIIRTAGVGQSRPELQRDLRYLLRLWESIKRGSTLVDFPGFVYRERDLVIRTIRDYFTPDISEVWIDSPETYERALEFVRDVMPGKAKVIQLYDGDRPLFSKFNLEDQIESIYKRRVPLPSGGEIIIDGTEALTAVDVNSARAARKGDAEDTVVQTNLEAAAEIARQLRLRDLGGIVVIDFIDMAATRNQKRVEKAMQSAMKGDKAKYDVTRISKLGLMEIARQRIRGEKMAASYAACPVCEGYGLLKNVEPASLSALRKLQVRCTRGDFGKMRMAVPPEVSSWILNHKREDLVQLEKRHGIRILIEGKPTLLRHEAEFETFARERMEAPAALVAPDRPLPPLPPDPIEFAASERQRQAPAAVAAAVPAPESDNAAEAPAGGARRKRKRRRRKSGSDTAVAATGADSPVPDETTVYAALPDKTAAMDFVTPRGDDGEVEPEDSEREEDDEGPEAADQAADGSAASEGGGDQPGPRRRRRRRRRRRGGSAQVAPGAPGAPADGDAVPVPAAAHTPVAPVPAEPRQPVSVLFEEEPIVPRGVRSEELMPAATANRRSRGARALRARVRTAGAADRSGVPPGAAKVREIAGRVRARPARPVRHLFLVLIVWTMLPVPASAVAPSPARPVATFSIVARDPATGNLGVAVQSHWFSVGSVVPWAEAGVGAIATQSFVEPAYGPRGLAALRAGKAPDAALRELLAADATPRVRQVAMIDAQGRVAAHTGEDCIPAAGHRTGNGYSVQANLMLSGEVPGAMAKAYEASGGPFEQRLLAALEAAQRVGGDIRGMQSAAIVIVRAKATDKPWTDRLIDLRVEDSPRPIDELRRLLRLHEAYDLMNQGDEAVASGAIDLALRRYSAAETLVPDNDEFVFWHAVTLVENGKLDDALPVFARAFRMNPSWMLLVPRLPGVKLLPATPGLVDKILTAGPTTNAPIESR